MANIEVNTPYSTAVTTKNGDKLKQSGFDMHERPNLRLRGQFTAASIKRVGGRARLVDHPQGPALPPSMRCRR